MLHVPDLMCRREMLNDRIIRTITYLDTHNDDVLTTRPARYSQWDETSMIKAMSAVERDGISVRRVSELYGIPKSTLHDRISG